MLREPKRTPLFWGLSLIYRWVVKTRRAAYRYGLLRQTAVHGAVLVIGNVVAGGAGKTPLCLACIQQLQAWGYRVGVVSRGYGRDVKRAPAITPVRPDSHWQNVGEEPLLLQQKSGVPVMVGADRVAAAQALLQAHPELDIVVLDDGLQHYALARDLEILLLDERGNDAGRVLPYGWLREPWPRQPLATPKRAAPTCLTLDLATAHGQAQYRTLLWDDVAQARLKQHACVAACAAIAQPERFFNMLKAQGLKVFSTLALPDHDAYAIDGPFAAWLKDLPAAMPIVCTEKDAIKLRQNWPQLQRRLIAPQLQLQVPAAFWHNLRSALQGLPTLKQRTT